MKKAAETDCAHEYRPAFGKIRGHIGWEYQAAATPQWPWLCSICSAVVWITHAAAIERGLAVLAYDYGDAPSSLGVTAQLP